MPVDKDLESIQQARDLANTAKEAQLEYKYYSQAQADKIVKAMADAGYEQAERLAKLAHEETGFGKWEDKAIKNGESFNITNYIINRIKIQLQNLKEDSMIHILDGTYDGALADFTDNKLISHQQRRNAFIRFDHKADYDQHMNIAFIAGQMDIINQLLN